MHGQKCPLLYAKRASLRSASPAGDRFIDPGRAAALGLRSRRRRPHPRTSCSIRGLASTRSTIRERDRRPPTIQVPWPVGTRTPIATARSIGNADHAFRPRWPWTTSWPSTRASGSRNSCCCRKRGWIGRASEPVGVRLSVRAARVAASLALMQVDGAPGEWSRRPWARRTSGLSPSAPRGELIPGAPAAAATAAESGDFELRLENVELAGALPQRPVAGDGRSPRRPGQPPLVFWSR